jgi:glycosyltransferase involved in cell wall biosynthesis
MFGAGWSKIQQVVSVVANSQEPFIQAQSLGLSGGRRLRGTLAEGTVNRPLVTVITAVYNGQEYMAGCLRSVLSQDYPNIEHIVMDGASSDGTVDVLRQYDDQIALWQSEPDAGVYDAWNKALAKARGEWICFLGVDDEFLPGAISAYMALASRNPAAEFLSSNVRWVHPSGYERLLGNPWSWREFSKWMCVAHSGSMHRRGLYERVGTYNTTYRIVGDYELLLRARSRLRTAYMPVTTVTMRAGGLGDLRRAYREHARAKMASGGRSRLLTAMEFIVSNAKHTLRPFRYSLARKRQRIHDEA